MESENREYFQLESTGEVDFLAVQPFTNRGVRAFFSTRKGGVSPAPYRSLNLAFHSGDSRKRVVKNRKVLADSLNFNLDSIVCATQVHGNNVSRVEKKMRGRGSRRKENALSNTDALITDCPGVTLFAFYADCVPLYFYDPEKEVIGLAHAGWRGTVLKIGLNVLLHMNLAFGSDPGSVLIALGPAICGSCYEVDNGVMKYFQNVFSDCTSFCTPRDKSKFLLDLRACNYQYLREAGINREQIFVSQWCSCEQEELFFSHRRAEEKTGRMAAVLSL